MSKQFSEQLQLLFGSKRLPWIIISTGIVLRVYRYIYNPSLWFDEAGSASDIIERSLTEILTASSNYGQTAPIGYVVVTKLATLIAGYSEYILRFFPLLSGITSILLFFKVARQYIRPEAVPVGLGLFAVLDPLVYLSSEFKPYASDVAITLLLYFATIFYSKRPTICRIVLFGIFGAVAVWFSHPSIFVLTGIGATLGISSIFRKDWKSVKKLSFTFSFWALSFVTVYFLYTRKLMTILSSLTNNDLFWMKQKAFMPFPPASFSDIQWFLELPSRIFNFPVGLTLSGFATFLFILGGVSIFSQKKERFFIIIAPVIIALLASSFKKFAFASTQLLFIVPSLLLFIAEGVEHIRRKTIHNSSIAVITVIVLLFIYPLSTAAHHIIKPHSREEIKPVLTYVKTNWQEGDILYVYYMSRRAFEYYSKYHPRNFEFNRNRYIIGRAPKDWYATYKRQEFTGFWNPEKPFSQPYHSILKEYTDELDKLAGNKRVWILFSSTVSKEGINEEKFFVYYLETIGKRLDFYGRSNIASVYLFDLNDQASKITQLNQ